jgi:hypothetical protein
MPSCERTSTTPSAVRFEAAWVPNQTVAMMLTLFDRMGALFVELHERKVARNRWINNLTLQTTDPEYE